MNAVAKDITVVPAQEVAPVQQAGESAAILSMIERASRDPSVDIVKFERLMEMRERVETRFSHAAFSAAVASAKAEIAPITRNAEGHQSKKYADFSAIARAVDPVLARHGLSYRFRSNQTDKHTIAVTCVLSHKDGHSEENTLMGGPDTSGSKNAIQSLGSALTYLQRYSLVQSLGLATSSDDDGKAAGNAQFVSDEQIEELQGVLISTASDVPKFLAYFKIESLSDFPASRFNEAKAMLLRKSGGAK